MSKENSSDEDFSGSEEIDLEEEDEAYGNREYWEERYSLNPNEIYDWYQDYQSCEPLKQLLNSRIPKKSKILIIGCGNSKLSEDMYADGYTSITSIDFAETAIKLMIERADQKGYALEYKVMDARQMDFPNVHFDAVIDKGTIDAVMCGENNTTSVHQICAEVSRVLKPKGTFIVITYGKPETREEYIGHSDFKWTLESTTIHKPDDDNFHYVYLMVKK